MIELTEEVIYYSYYTHEELIEILERLKNINVPEEYQKDYFIGEIKNLITLMERHKLKIYIAHTLLSYTEGQELISMAGIKPHLYTVNFEAGDWKITTAPNLIRGTCCGTCKHHISDYDSCECSIHTQSDTRYDPPDVEQLEVFYTDICEDYERVVTDDGSTDSP